MKSTFKDEQLKVPKEALKNYIALCRSVDLSIAMHANRQISPLIDNSRSVDLPKNYNVVHLASQAREHLVHFSSPPWKDSVTNLFFLYLFYFMVFFLVKSIFANFWNKLLIKRNLSIYFLYLISSNFMISVLKCDFLIKPNKTEFAFDVKTIFFKSISSNLVCKELG